MPRPPPKKHPVKAVQPAWRPGDARQVISQSNQGNDAPAATLSVTVPGSSSIQVPHALGRLPKSAWVSTGAPKVTVTGATTANITLTNSDAAPQAATVALS